MTICKLAYAAYRNYETTEKPLHLCKKKCCTIWKKPYFRKLFLLNDLYESNNIVAIFLIINYSISHKILQILISSP